MDLIHQVGRHDRRESQEGRVVRLDRMDRISRDEIALLQRILNGKRRQERILFILVPHRQ